MKLTCVTDLHGNADMLTRILRQAGETDLVLLGGDITNFGTPNEAEGLVEIARQIGAPVLAVAGNCDSRAIESRLEQLGVSLMRRGAAVNDLGLVGLAAMPPWMGTMYELPEEELAAALRAGRAMLDGFSRHVLLSHAPPRDTNLDKTRQGAHVGSMAVRNYIDEHGPAVVICGHIHESRGIQTIGATRAVNCGPGFDGHYARVEIDDEIQIDLRRA
jgi:Icc-related predicted phosphoesterase